MQYLLLCVSVLLGTGKNMVSKHTGNKFSGLSNLFKTNIITALIAITYFAFRGINVEIFRNPAALALGFLYGIFTMLSQMLFIKAVEHSAAGVCSLIYSMGFIIPTLFSVVLLNEPFGALKTVGFVLILVCFLLVGSVKGGNTNKLYFAFLAMTASGIIGIIQKLIAKVPEKFVTTQYLTVAFAVMLTGSVVGLLIIKEKSCKVSREFLLTSSAMGVCVTFANSINTSLAGKMPGIIFFTCVNGGTIILSCIASRIIFSEKLRPLQMLGIALGITAIILLVL